MTYWVDKRIPGFDSIFYFSPPLLLDSSNHLWDTSTLDISCLGEYTQDAILNSKCNPSILNDSVLYISSSDYNIILNLNTARLVTLYSEIDPSLKQEFSHFMFEQIYEHNDNNFDQAYAQNPEGHGVFFSLDMFPEFVNKSNQVGFVFRNPNSRLPVHMDSIFIPIDKIEKYLKPNSLYAQILSNPNHNHWILKIIFLSFLLWMQRDNS